MSLPPSQPYRRSISKVITLSHSFMCFEKEMRRKAAWNQGKIEKETKLFLSSVMLPVWPCVFAALFQFQGGLWSLNMHVCDGLMTMDVMLCTASIFNLCAISIDRLSTFNSLLTFGPTSQVVVKALTLSVTYDRNSPAIQAWVDSLISPPWCLS